jgi:hypothetical protein
MRVARYREASEKAPTQIGAPEATLIRPEALLNASPRSLTAQSGDLESVPFEGFKHQSVEDIEDNGLSFTAVYKKGYGDE